MLKKNNKNKNWTMNKCRGWEKGQEKVIEDEEEEEEQMKERKECRVANEDNAKKGK